MSRIRIIMVSILAVFGVSAVASATAAAEKCPARKGTAPVVCVENGSAMEEAPVGTKLMNLGMLVNSQLKGEVNANKILLLGLLNLLELEYEGEGKGKGTITFNEIHVDKPAKCTVSEPIIASFSGAIVELAGGEFDIDGTGNKTKGTETEIFAEFEFKNSGAEVCPIKGDVVNVKGTQVVHYKGATKLPFAVNNAASTTFTDSNLKMGNNKAEFQEEWPDIAIWNGTSFTGQKWGILQA